MAAFNDAIAFGVDFIETDVWHSSDRVAFLIHDATLSATCAPYTTSAVSSLTAAQLSTVRCGGRSIPRLDQLVARLRRPEVHTCLLIEIANSVRSALQTSNDCVMATWPMVNAAFVSSVHAAGAKVIAYTVNDPRAMRTLAAAGVDGLVTDHPRAALSTLDG